jgi:PKD repeat protein
MRKFLHALFTLMLVLHFVDSKAQVTLGTVDAGPYGIGSNITVPISFPGNLSSFPADNSFELQLSDAAGVFSATPTSLGTFSGFYTTGLNGVIPAGLLAGTGYKLRIRTSNPDNVPAATITDVPGTIEISTAGSRAVTLTQTNISTSITGDNLGFCPIEAGNNKQVTLKSNSTGITTTSIVVTNMATGVSTTYAEPPGGLLLTGLATGTYAVKVTASTLVGTQIIKSSKTYTLHNNPLVVNIQDIGESRGCLDGMGNSAGISFGVTITGAGITNNDPQVFYRVDWGDGTTSDLTLADIANNASKITHGYITTSCGQPPIQGGTGTITNSFKATISAISPICGTAASTTAYAQIFLNPVAIITPSSTIGCINVPMIFNNSSRGGTRFDCTTRMDYTWYVDGVPVSPQPANADPLVYTFTTAGPHTVRLEASNGVGTCTASISNLNVCIQLAPYSSFTLPGASPVTICANSILTPTNTSFIDNTCTPDRNFRWIVEPVTAGGPVTYAGGTNVNSETPQFVFTVPGVYNISLGITNPTCGETISPRQSVIVNTSPTATLSPGISLCSPGAYTFSDANPASPTYTTVSGTFNDLPDTYTWSVTGGNYTITNNDLHTKFPTITFADFSTYTVTLLHTNNCGTTPVATQVITFIPSPTIDLGPDQSICFINNASLNATVTGAIISSAWSGGAGGTFSDPANLVSSYIPSAQDKLNGSAVLTLTITTNLAEPCRTVSKSITITIKPEIKITSASALSICTGSALNYQPTANLNLTTFVWTATGSANATGYANGSGTAIPDILTDTDPINNATVSYIITPTNDGCPGVPFTLTVTVTPKPVISTALPEKTICSNNPSAATVTSNIPTAFTYTSVATAGITGNTPAFSQATPSTSLTINDVLINNTTAQGTVTYTVTPTTATGCPGDPVTVIVHIDPALTVANAGPAESICDLTSYTLKGNHADVGTGTWTFIPVAGQTGITITNPNSENAVASGLASGQAYTFRWTISAPGACGASSSDVVITVNVPTVAGTTATADPTVVCEAANSGTVTLSGFTGAVLNWQSSTDGGATWLNIPTTNSTLTYNNITVNTQYRALVQNGSCDPKFSTATAITVTPATTIANAGNDRALCNETSVQLNALSALKINETGMWTVSPASPNLTITDPSNPATTVTNLNPGQIYTFTWTITGPSPCGPTRDDVIITDHLPLTNTISSSSTEVCFNQTITITGDTPTGGDGSYTYIWEVSDDGTNWNLISGQTGKDLSYQLQATLNFRRTVTSSACLLISNTIRIVTQPPIANNSIAADQTICTGILPVALTGSVPTGSDGNFNYQWQSSSNGTIWTDIATAVFPAYAPPALTATTYYRRLVSTITCNGDLKSTSNTVTIIVKPNAKAEFTYALDKACTPFVIDANNVKAVPYPDRNATYTWYANDVLIGTGITFPGYTISASNTTVTIKLVTAPSTGCQPDQMLHDFSTNQAVAASFTQSATTGCGPLILNFVNTSTSLTGASFKWDFGNGVTSSQTMPAPVTFQPDPTGKDITYTVTLSATTTCGTNSITSTVFVKAKPISVFSPSRTVGCSPMTVTFTNTSPGETNTYYYDFGDGTLLTKTDKLPVTHTFITNTVRDFVVRMVSENECGRDESTYTIRVSPNTVLPELVVNANEKEGCAPFAVNFYNNTRGANLFKYDFGDGSTVITRSAPEIVKHTFTASGTYTITLTASNGCSDTTTTESVTVLPQPVTAFSADVTLGCPGLAVQFKNTSVDGVSYLWDFGDGSTSNEFQPRHIFTGTQEFYTISLTATNSLGCTATTTMNQYIHVVPPPVALFNVAPSTLISIPNYTFRFEDESTNSPTIWAWDFGDGTTSALKNPSHTYPDTGKYVVTLRVSNQQGCFTTTFKTVTIVGVPGYLYVPNSFMPGSQTPELREFSAKGSGIKTWRMTVFNKWGQSLWETTLLNEGRPVEGWDGTFNAVPQPQGVYFWKIDVEFINGTAWKGMTYDSSAPKKTGVIHLLR